MKVQDYRRLSATKHPELEGVELRHIRDLRGKRVEDVELRIFVIQPGTTNPPHTHTHTHDLFIVKGTGLVRQGTDEHRISEGDVVSIAPDEPHSFVNDSNDMLQFLCMDCRIAEEGS